jgi:SAM-dependent methyltransferase
MNSKSKQEIRNAVRKTYATIAKGNGAATDKNRSATCSDTIGTPSSASQVLSCCGPSNMSAEEGASELCGCVPPDVSAEQMSTIMGYTQEDIKGVPEGANMGLGCGNPVALASLRPGETVVDLGSGGGFDCFLAAKAVGEAGKVIGVDMTPDMVSKARSNAEKIEADNVDFRLGEIENLPIADNTADIVMSNCVINLSPDKQNVYNEAFRVLKPGGRLSISDVLATAELPDNIRNDLALVGACVGGAATIETTRELLEKAGFEDVRIELNDHSRELIREWDPRKSEKATDYVVSAYIQAIKPTLSM